jgi:hypothetical protein
MSVFKLFGYIPNFKPSTRAAVFGQSKNVMLAAFAIENDY